MPQTLNVSGQDWEPVNAGKAGIPGAKVVAPKTAREITNAKAAGLITTELRHGAGSNKSAHTTGTGISAKKLEEADDVGTIAKVDKSLSIAIMQARTAKKMTQKDLATAINEKPQVVAEYETGKATPNPSIIAKLEKSLGVKLPRSGAKAVKVPAKTATPGTATSTAPKKPAPNTHGGLTRGGPPKRR